MITRVAPGRALVRSGVFLFALAALGLVACEAALETPPTVQLDTVEVQLRSGTSLHDVTIGGVGAVDSIAPDQIAATTGDAVRFTIADHRTHAIAFAADRLDPTVRMYLEDTNQLRGPPLVHRGGAWIVVLDGAPPGRYPFLCRSHGVEGLLVVGPGD